VSPPATDRQDRFLPGRSTQSGIGYGARTEWTVQSRSFFPGEALSS